ncbi:MAG: hypothetical protein VX121_09685, partial [Pseudomonadota bacterium]|nr:hypothetical protein [Pseudomonadota bacterium]
LRGYQPFIEDSLQRIQVAIRNAGQTASQAVGELFHTHALVGHELPVYGRQGFDQDVKIGTLGD